jgi:hypothetical protein
MGEHVAHSHDARRVDRAPDVTSRYTNDAAHCPRPSEVFGPRPERFPPVDHEQACDF